MLFFIFILSSRFDSDFQVAGKVLLRMCVRECDVLNLFTKRNHTDWMSYWARMWHRGEPMVSVIDVCIDTVVSTRAANLTFILSLGDSVNSDFSWKMKRFSGQSIRRL